MDVVWIYSILNDTLVKNESPSLFQNLFPNKHNINSILGAHYSPKTKKFYFFTGLNIFSFLYFYYHLFNNSNFLKINFMSNMKIKIDVL